MAMNDEALLRYSRQIMLDAIDIEGQERLLASRVLVVGAGGLGSPVALYLAAAVAGLLHGARPGAAGVGHLILADADAVELSNLQRQIAHGMADLQRNKACSARDSALALNPGCDIRVIEAHLDEAALDAVVADVDLVLDCTDRFSSRYAINAACRRAGVPLVSGAAIRFSGQLAVFDPRDPAAPLLRLPLPAGRGRRRRAALCREWRRGAAGGTDRLLSGAGGGQAAQRRRQPAPRALHLRRHDGAVASLPGSARSRLSSLCRHREEWVMVII